MVTAGFGSTHATKLTIWNIDKSGKGKDDIKTQESGSYSNFHKHSNLKMYYIHKYDAIL